jgi:hypothetical protein
MSWLGDTWGFLKDSVSDFFSNNSSSSSSNSSHNYEPDKVKIAEINQQTQLQLAGKENERIELMKQAKLEILQEEAKFQQALYVARIKGLEQMSQIIIAMQERFNEIAQNRLKIIEFGSMNIIKDIEQFYHELQSSIEKKDVEFTENKLPVLLEQLEKYQQGSAAHQLYFKKIDALITTQARYAEQALTDLSARQKQIIASSLSTKEKITEHTDRLTAQLVERIVLSSEMLRHQLTDTAANYSKRLVEPESQPLLENQN